MKKILLLAASLIGLSALHAQVYKADTAFVTDFGGGGAKASAISKPNGTNYGLAQNRDSFFVIGEDFTVPAGQTWNLDTVIIYAYQTGSSINSTITAATLKIAQNTVTGTTVFGDTTTNRMVATDFTGIYRVDTAAANGGVTSLTRPIMRVKIKLTPTKALTAGTYWLIFGCKGNSTFTGPWCPPKVLPGRINPTGQNGMQRNRNGWLQAKDSLSPSQVQTLGFNYILKGPQKTAGGVGIEETAQLNAVLEQNAPNPATGNTTIGFTLLRPDAVKLSLYSSTGQLVRTLIDKKVEAGRSEVSLDTRSLAAGMYYYRLQTDGGIQTKTLEVLK